MILKKKRIFLIGVNTQEKVKQNDQRNMREKNNIKLISITEPDIKNKKSQLIFNKSNLDEIKKQDSASENIINLIQSVNQMKNNSKSEIKFSIEKKENKEFFEKSKCVICFENISNAVFLQCGHGGQ